MENIAKMNVTEKDFEAFFNRRYLKAKEGKQ